MDKVSIALLLVSLVLVSALVFWSITDTSVFKSSSGEVKAVVVNAPISKTSGAQVNVNVVGGSNP